MTSSEHNAEALAQRLRDILSAREAERQRAEARDRGFQQARDEAILALWRAKLLHSQIGVITGLSSQRVSVIVKAQRLRERLSSS